MGFSSATFDIIQKNSTNVSTATLDERMKQLPEPLTTTVMKHEGRLNALNDQFSELGNKYDEQCTQSQDTRISGIAEQEVH